MTTPVSELITWQIVSDATTDAIDGLCRGTRDLLAKEIVALREQGLPEHTISQIMSRFVLRLALGGVIVFPSQDWRKV